MSSGYSSDGNTWSGPAAADYSAKQYYAMKLTGGAVTLCTAAGELSIGVLVNDPASGQAASVRTGGIVPALAGVGGVTNGDKIATAADGTLITTVTSGHYVLGVALETASAGERFSLLLTHSVVP